MTAAYHNYSDLPLTMNARALQQALGISRAAAYRLLHDPLFPSIHVGSRILVPRDKFILWIDEQVGCVDSEKTMVNSQ